MHVNIQITVLINIWVSQYACGCINNGNNEYMDISVCMWMYR